MLANLIMNDHRESELCTEYLFVGKHVDFPATFENFCHICNDFLLVAQLPKIWLVGYVRMDEDPICLSVARPRERWRKACWGRPSLSRLGVPGISPRGAETLSPPARKNEVGVSK